MTSWAEVAQHLGGMGKTVDQADCSDHFPIGFEVVEQD
jgi:hypothetical protein